MTTSISPRELWLKAPEQYQRLEFLGDAVLGMAIAEELYHRWPDLPEGPLSLMRSTVVSAPTLATVARRYGLFTDTETEAAELRGDKTLCDRLEAAIGMLFVERGYAVCKQVILQWLEPELEALDPDTDYRHPKTNLQELLTHAGEELPEYESIEAEAENQHAACCSFFWRGTEYRFQASAKTIREAQRRAAEKALQWLENTVNDS